jgi:hypothetical protein
MLGNRKLICDTFCEVYDLLKPWIDHDFFNFREHTIIPGAIYMIGRAQVNLNVDKIKNIAENNLATIIISNPAEGSETLKHHMQRIGLIDLCVSGRILLLGGGDMEPEFKFLCFDSFLPKIFDYEENVQASSKITEIFTKQHKPYKFLFLNGRARPNRKYLLHYFQHIGLLDQTIWTNLDTFTGTTSEIHCYINNEDLMLHNMPIKLLDEKYEIDRYRSNLQKQYSTGWAKNDLFEYQGGMEWGDVYINPAPYIDSYFSVVTETIFTYPYSFRTEKLWKPIAMGHPFVVVSNQGFYRDLHNLGFKTFGHLIDENFDTIQHNLTRLKRMRDVIVDLCNSDLPSFLSAARDVCEYNQKHLWEMRDKVRNEFPHRYREFLIEQGVTDE